MTVSANVAIPTNTTMNVTPAQISDSTGLRVPPNTNTPTNAAAAKDSERNAVSEVAFLAIAKVYFDDDGVAAATPSCTPETIR